MTRTAVVLFNLGGPDRLESVGPFLFNLFNDPNITEMPQPLRWLFARLITKRRVAAVKANYSLMGGKTPLLAETNAQARAVEAALADLGEVRCFVAMRYWHPTTEEAARAVRAFDPDEIVLLPLYPHYSHATTGSSLRVWNRAFKSAGSRGRVRALCCYPAHPGFVAAHADLIRAGLANAAADGPVRLLFSAHGLPERSVERGDPYQWQIERTCEAVVKNLAMPDLDWTICYQSRVGPLKWIGPYTDSELERAGRDGVAVVMTPIAFVSEHIETLVEMDDEYASLARLNGCRGFHRVPALGIHPGFVGALADLVRARLAAPSDVGDPVADGLHRICPAEFGRCPCRGDVTS